MEYEGETWLWSVYMDVRWPGPVLQADEHPSWSSQHSIYAYRKPRSQCEVSRGDVRLPVRELGMLAGWVDLYGHIVEHADGYRAEWALVAGLLAAPPAVVPLLGTVQRRLQTDGPTPEGRLRGGGTGRAGPRVEIGAH